MTRVLERAPRVFTLQLTWDGPGDPTAGLAATLAAVDERVSAARLLLHVLTALCDWRFRAQGQCPPPPWVHFNIPMEILSDPAWRLVGWLIINPLFLMD